MTVDPANVAALGFSLAAMPSFGVSDFLGGYASRRTNPFLVTTIGSACALVLLVALALALEMPFLTTESLAWSVMSGACSGAGLSVYYRALASSRMGVAAPLTAVVGMSVPAVIGLAGEGAPGPTVVVGFACAAVGLWQLCRPDGSMRPEGIRLALIAGLGFAAYTLCLHRTNQAAAPWVAVFSRLGSLTVTSAIVTAQRAWAVPARPALCSFVGVFDALGTLFFIRANQTGRLDIAVVVTSLYPLVTVALARVVLQERLSRAKLLGVIAALVAVPLIAVR